MPEYKKPLPVPSIESQPYWNGLRERRLLMPRCDACGTHWFPPTLLCPSCSTKKWSWTAVSGRGRIFSYVVYHRIYHPGFADEIPYAVAVIQLDEGPRLVSNVIGVAPDQLVCDMPVEVVYQPVTDNITLPKLKPVGQP